MGLSIDKETFSQADYGLFAERLQQSLVVLRDLLDRPGFGDGPKTLGTEMELSIVDQEGCAYPINRSVLAGNLDPSFQLELDRFNLEYNTSPVPLAGTPFSRMSEVIRTRIQRGCTGARGNAGCWITWKNTRRVGRRSSPCWTGIWKNWTRAVPLENGRCPIESGNSRGVGGPQSPGRRHDG